MKKVKFYIEQGDVFAYFPDIIHNGESKTCYAHVGQHSACHPDYLKGKKQASVEAYFDLYRELIGQGYGDLVVLNKSINEQVRRQSDINAGKVWQIRLESHPEKLEFECKSRGACIKWLKENDEFKNYKKGLTRLSQVIYEPLK